MMENTGLHQTLEESWEGLEPAPIEFLHGQIMRHFHEFRIAKNGIANVNVQLNGSELTKIIAQAKQETYKKYEKSNLTEAVKTKDLI